MDSAPASASASAAAAERRRAAVEAVRALPASAFVVRSFAEALAFGAVASPALLAYFSLLGVVDAHLAARAPRASSAAAAAAAAPLSPLSPLEAARLGLSSSSAAAASHAAASSSSSGANTFSGLAAAGLRYGLGATARTVGWCGAAAAASAVLREALATGPRHEDASLRNPLFHLAGAAGGAAAGSALTLDWAKAMGRGRRAAFLVLSGALGAALPFALAAAGPGVRRRLSALVPAAAEGAGGSGGGGGGGGGGAGGVGRGGVV